MCYKKFDTNRLTQTDAKELCWSQEANLLQLKTRDIEEFFQHLNYKGMMYVTCCRIRLDYDWFRYDMLESDIDCSVGWIPTLLVYWLNSDINVS